MNIRSINDGNRMARTIGSTRQKTRQAIIMAANELFAERGYAAISMRAIAEKVGIQAGALYNYFKTKQDVLLTIMRDHMEELINEWKKRLDLSAHPACQLETFVRFHVRYHITRRTEVFISFMELRSLEDENFVKLEKLRQIYEYDIRDILKRGKALGCFEFEDAHVSAMALIAMLTGVTTWYKPEGRLSAAAIEENYLKLVQRAVCPSKKSCAFKKEAS